MTKKNIFFLVDGLFIFDNSEGKHELLAIKTVDGQLNIIDELKYKKLKAYDNR